MDPIRIFVAVLILAAMGFLCMVAWHQIKICVREWSKRDE